MAAPTPATVLPTLAPVVGDTGDQEEYYRRLAQLLAEKAGSDEPISHWTQGVGRLAEALAGKYVGRKADKAKAASDVETWAAYQEAADAGLFEGGGGGYAGGYEGETAETPNMEPVASTGDEADMIIRTVIGEAAGEPPEGQQAVAAVIMNRAKQAGMTPSQVVLAKGQFEPWGSRAGQLQAIDPNSEQYRRVAANVLPVLQGQAPDPTGGATHFYSPSAQAGLGRSTPSWAHGPSQDIGRHRFFSLGYGGGGRHGIPRGETAEIPGAEAVGSEPTPDVINYIMAEELQDKPLTPEQRIAQAMRAAQPPQAPQSMPRGVPPAPQEMPTSTPTPSELPLTIPIQRGPHALSQRPEPVPPTPLAPATPPAPLQDMFPPRPRPVAPPAPADPRIAAAMDTTTSTYQQPVPGTPAPLSPVPPPAPLTAAQQPLSKMGAPPPSLIQPPAAAASPAARVPQARPAAPAAPAPVAATPAVTGAIAGGMPQRPIYSPPVKNDYNALPGRPPAAMPMRPGQLMQEPYSGPMSAQEFARQGQAAMRARKAGQQPTGLAQAAGPRRGILQALLGRGGTGQPAAAPAAPTGLPAAPGAVPAEAAAPAAMTPQRAALTRLLASKAPDAIKLAAIKAVGGGGGRRPADYTLDGVRYSGVTNQPIAGERAPEKGTDDQREYQLAVGQGYKGSFVDYMREMKKAGATTIQTGTPEAGDAKLRENLSKAEGDRWSALQQGALTAGTTAQDMAVMDELITMAPQGPIVGRLAAAFPEFSSSGALFNSIVKKIAPTLRVPGSGATSDIEYQGMLDSLTALQNKPEANRAIAEMIKSKAALDIERGTAIDAYMDGTVDAAATRAQLAKLNKQSIMTPAMRGMLEGMRGDEAAGEAPPGVDPELWKRMKPEQRKLWQ